MFVLYLTPVHEGVISKCACLSENGSGKSREKRKEKRQQKLRENKRENRDKKLKTKQKTVI